nr:MAG TPA: hypothetical protein [Caudoviricetes sp.]
MSKFQEYIETKNRYERLEKQLKKAQDDFEKTIPFQKSKKYWFIDSEGNIKDTNWYTDSSDLNRFNLGNTFNTKEEAEKELLRRVVVSKVGQFRRECYGDWVPDWGNDDEEKYTITSNGMYFFATQTNCDIFNIFGYFKYEKECKKALDLFSDDLYKWLNYGK